MIFKLTVVLCLIGLSCGCGKNSLPSGPTNELIGTYRGICIYNESSLDFAEGPKSSTDTVTGVELRLVDITAREDDPTIGMIYLEGDCVSEAYEFPIDQLHQDTIFGAIYGALRYTYEIRIDQRSKSIYTYYLLAPSLPYRSERIGLFRKTE